MEMQIKLSVPSTDAGDEVHDASLGINHRLNAVCCFGAER